MKNYLLSEEEKLLLKKRSLIESVFNILKNSMNLEHSKRISPINFIVHIMSSVASFAIRKIVNIALFYSKNHGSLS